MKPTSAGPPFHRWLGSAGVCRGLPGLPAKVCPGLPGLPGSAGVCRSGLPGSAGVCRQANTTLPQPRPPDLDN